MIHRLTFFDSQDHNETYKSHDEDRQGVPSPALTYMDKAPHDLFLVGKVRLGSHHYTDNTKAYKDIGDDSSIGIERIVGPWQ
jgi:hypothetical protein